MVPSGNLAGASFVIVMGSKMSVAVAVPISTGVVIPVASVVTSGGSVTTGGVVSTTVTNCVSVVAELPDVSVAVQCTSVVPSGNLARESVVMGKGVEMGVAGAVQI